MPGLINGPDAAIKQIKSRLLPLTPLTAALERLLERLPRQLIQVELKQTPEVSVVNEGRGEYMSRSDEPLFEMILTPASQQGGWYYLEAALTRNDGSRTACIRGELPGVPSGKPSSSPFLLI